MSKKILIIDDEENIALGMKALLEHAGGIEVATANDPEAGLKKAKSWRPDVVLMDIYMPKFDGWEATRRLKAGKGTKDIRVVVTTAVYSKELREKVSDCGADRLITKPCDKGDIQRLLDWLG